MLRCPLPTARARVVLVAAVGTALVAATLASPASAATTRTPAKATHLRLSAATSTSLTVSSSRATYATKYRLFVSTVKTDLHYDNIIHNKYSSARHYATASGPRVTVGGLKYTTAPYYYRIQAFNGKKYSVSADIMTGGLRPATPTKLKVTDVGGLSLTWSSGASTGFTVAQSTSADMSAGRHNWTISGSTHQFTPYGIKAGQRYYFAIRATNNGTSGTYSAHANGVTSAHEQSLRVMTYNVLLVQSDGLKESGGTVAPWSQRGPAAAALIKKASPDVLAVQEAGGWTDENAGTRQIDTLVHYLGSGYALAHTENDFAQMKAAHSYVRHYSYIVYKRSAFTAVGNGGFWALDSSSASDPHWAAWQQLRSVKTGATFLAVSAHLVVGNTTAMDKRRQSEAKVLVADASGLASSRGLKVIYAGDMNSNYNTKYHPLNGPGSVMQPAGIADARLVAQTHANNYNSVNFLERTPSPYPIDVIDYVYLTPGTSASSWALAINLSKGKIVGLIPSDHHPVWVTAYIRY